MKKGQCYEGIVESVQFPAKGIVRVEEENDKAVVKNVIPGQKISFRVSKKRKGKAEGTLLEVGCIRVPSFWKLRRLQLPEFVL